MSAFYITDSFKGIMDIPYDILEILIGFMRNDVARLKNASLVCQSWNSASQTWLFRKLTLGPEKYSKLVALIQNPDSCSFTAHCRTLVVNAIDVQTIPPSFIALFPSLAEFSLQAASVPSLKNLFEFISNFPRLRSVTLDNVSWIGTAPIPLPSIPSVECLEVHGDMKYDRFFDQLKEFKVFPKLLRLSAGPMRELHLPFFGRYVSSPNAVLPGIQSLAMTMVDEGHLMYMPPTFPIEVVSKEVHMAHDHTPLRDKYRSIYAFSPCVIPFPHIRRFRIKGFIDQQNTAQSTAIMWTPRFLATMWMPNLQRIELDILVDSVGQIDRHSIHWPFIDFALTTAEFGNLRKVVFIVLGLSDMMNLADLLSRRLPLTSERGLLYVRSGEDGRDRSVAKLFSRP